MKKIINYIKESAKELVYKVSWPNRQELTSSTIVVLTASFIMAMVIFVIDFGFENIVKFFYGKIF
ncbi:MAG: preprotein translocase subunit SecE [Dysgonamonadaceae bacterium]|jgi:preprotein translocase subunit SecE|nr:preprotein translocase subunit SecE [Dysgonamonadaceae bacterium]